MKELNKDVAFFSVVAPLVSKEFFNDNFVKIGNIKGSQQRDLFINVLKLGYLDNSFEAFDIIWGIMVNTKLTFDEIIRLMPTFIKLENLRS